MLSALRAIAVFVLSLACFPGVTRAEQWSRFRGPNGSGIADDQSYPSEFGVAKNMLWKRPMLPGKSSPVLTDSKIFLTAQDGENSTVLCLDRATGKSLWQRSIGQSRREFQHSLNSPAAATPATDGENVYAFFGNFGLISYDGSGKERWRTPLGPFSSLWGMASSPVLVDGIVVLLVDAFGESYIAAFDQKNGKQKWKTTRRPFALNYSTPEVRKAVNGELEIIVLGPGQIVSYAANTGTVRWSADIPGGSIVASPALSQNIILSLTYSLETVPSFDEQLRNLDKNGDGRLTADEFGAGENARVLETFGNLYGNRNGVVEREEWAQVWQEWIGKPAATAVRLIRSEGGALQTEKAWSYHRSIPRVSSPIVYNGIAYLLANGGILTALDANTGTLLKTGRLTGALDNYFASPVASLGKLFFASETGKIVVVKGGADWRILAINDLGSECYATPALSKGDIFIRTANHLFCFRASMTAPSGESN